MKWLCLLVVGFISTPNNNKHFWATFQGYIVQTIERIAEITHKNMFEALDKKVLAIYLFNDDSVQCSVLRRPLPWGHGAEFMRSSQTEEKKCN